jgi:hypothetical protein
MHFLFSLLLIKDLYMFQALLAQPQEALHKRHLVCFVRVMSLGCTRIEVELVQPTDITRTQYTKCRLCSNSWGWASNAQNMYRPLILNKLKVHHVGFTILIYYDARSAKHETLIQYKLELSFMVLNASMRLLISVWRDTRKAFCHDAADCTCVVQFQLLLAFFSIKYKK